MSKTPSAPPGRPDDATYAIRLRGHLDPRWAARLAVSSLTHESDGTTTLHATGVDQAALHGLLQQVRNLGLNSGLGRRCRMPLLNTPRLPTPAQQRNPK